MYRKKADETLLKKRESFEIDIKALSKGVFKGQLTPSAVEHIVSFSANKELNQILQVVPGKIFQQFEAAEELTKHLIKSQEVLPQEQLVDIINHTIPDVVRLIKNSLSHKLQQSSDNATTNILQSTIDLVDSFAKERKLDVVSSSQEVEESKAVDPGTLDMKTGGNFLVMDQS